MKEFEIFKISRIQELKLSRLSSSSSSLRFTIFSRPRVFKLKLDMITLPPLRKIHYLNVLSARRPHLDVKVHREARTGMPEDTAASSNYRSRNSAAERSDFLGITWISWCRYKMMLSLQFMSGIALLLSIVPVVLCYSR